MFSQIKIRSFQLYLAIETKTVTPSLIIPFDESWFEQEQLLSFDIFLALIVSLVYEIIQKVWLSGERNGCDFEKLDLIGICCQRCCKTSRR